ncbi:helix-turn-helix transcriptional regulator [Cellulomonas xiejunii]|uniref:WYL domain-containing protein n=1 Tax=Cellulomonas xiejunii TaxID=2968083 RepID=A0ABY5KMF1_9CELL|nr:WYL domain-containing protein [Cellulomonas xiejunii]MCC2321094.1 WYL domain-containing protein [Cellulomonas xiejunii]UUI71687.1 WYL domain-containing protein [Cellulomonas xiejunii]
MATSDTSPTSRALLALAELQASPGTTAAGLAAALGVSERAARRYVAILRESGVPVTSVRGPYGGYRVGRGVRLPPLVFGPDEALGLVMAVLDGHHDVRDRADPVGSALDKLLRALPERVAAQAAVVRRSTATAPDRAAARPDPVVTTALVQACADHRPVRVRYRAESGHEWDADVDAWSVVVRHGRWYLVCRRHDGDAVRTYRVDRVLTVLTLPGTAAPAPDVDPVVLLEEHLAQGWEHDVDVLIEAAYEDVARRLPTALGRLEPVGPATTRLVATTSNPVWYAQQLAVVPVPFRVVGGPEMRACVRDVGARLVAAVDDV